MGLAVAVIGGGAAGFFSAINIAERLPEADITIYEGSNKVLTKVLVSGGGRCNVTNKISVPKKLIEHYPRGRSFLKPVFEQFNSDDTRKWFDQRGVPTKTESDGRVFPASNSSKSIYDCLTLLARKNNVELKTSHRLSNISFSDSGWELTINNALVPADILILCTGSNPKIYKLLQQAGIEIVDPVPSLFTFNAKDHPQKKLAGVSVPNASVRINQIKEARETGPLLITHWGYSAPSVLRLSAWYARELSDLDYSFNFLINWNNYNEEELRQKLKSNTTDNPKSKVLAWKDHGLPKRLWHSIFEQSNLREFTNWSEVGKKGINKLVNLLCHFDVRIEGKSTFKEEFVTAGGIDLTQVDSSSMAVNTHPNLYAAGEVLNIDGITGGFNFQAAWSESYVIANSIANTQSQ